MGENSRIRAEFYEGDTVVLDGCITVTFEKKNGARIRLTIDAPREVSVQQNRQPRAAAPSEAEKAAETPHLAE